MITSIKRVFTLLIFLSGAVFSYQAVYAQALGLNNATPDASSILDLTATNRGLLVPRMTQAQRNAIASPANSLLIYQTDNTPGYYYNSGTPGAPVWVTLSPSVSEASSTTNITTTSTTYVLATSMTLTPGAGDYMVMFSSSVQNNTGNQTVFASVYVNGAQLAHTERRFYAESSIPNTPTPIATQAYVTGLGAGQAIEIRWRVTGGTGTMYNRTMNLIRIN